MSEQKTTLVAGKAISTEVDLTHLLPQLKTTDGVVALEQLADPDDSPVERWAATRVFTSEPDSTGRSRYAAGYNHQNRLVFLASRDGGDWSVSYFDVNLPALELVFRDPQARDQFARIIEKVAKGDMTHVLLSPLLAQLLDVQKDD